MKKIALLISFLSILNAGWDQSLDRWEMDCNYDNASACSIAASMYADGKRVVFEDGVNITHKMKKDLPKALKLYEKACNLGDKLACKNAKKIARKLGKKVNIVDKKENKKNYSIKKDKKYIIYTINGKKSCQIKFTKRYNVVYNGCKSLVNSKGVNILCTKDMKVCKTSKEIFEAIKK